MICLEHRKVHLVLEGIFVEGHRVSTARVPSRILCPKECNWPFLSPSFPLSCPPTIDTAAVTRGTLCTRGSRVFQLVHARPSPDELARRCPPRVPVPEIGSHAHSRSHPAIHYQHEKLLRASSRRAIKAITRMTRSNDSRSFNILPGRFARNFDYVIHYSLGTLVILHRGGNRTFADLTRN